MSIGKRIRALRLEKDLTQEQFARQIGEKRANISSWETDRSKPDLNSLKNLSTFFDKSIDYILYGGDANRDLVPGVEILGLTKDESGSFKMIDFTKLNPEQLRIIIDLAAQFQRDNDKNKQNK